MKINQSQEITITQETAVSSYHNGLNYCCVLIEEGENLTLSFDSNCLEQLTNIITHLQQMQKDLVEERQVQLEREVKLLSAYKAAPQILLPFAELGDF